MAVSGRYELKYIVEEARAQAISDYLRSYLQPSAHNRPGPLPGHPVVSLYMDSPDFFLFRQAYTGHKNRMKLRIRFYDDDWNRPAFLEIKRRISDVICKERAMISREGVRQMLTGGWPTPSYWPDHALLKHGKRRADVHDRFWTFADTIHARGMVYVSYVREVWEATDNEELRVTFDRHVRGSRYDGSGRLRLPTSGWRPYLPYYPLDGVIIEMKFDDRAPRWMYDMVKLFNMERRAVCKYTGCIDGARTHWQQSSLPPIAPVRSPLPELEEEFAL